MLTAQSHSALSLDAVMGYVVTAVAMTVAMVCLISPSLGKFPSAVHNHQCSSEKPTHHVCCHKKNPMDVIQIHVSVEKFVH